MSEIINTYSIKLVNSFLLTLVFLGGYLSCKFFLTRRIKNKKIRSQYIIRYKYLFFIFFMIFFIKIWVEGFIQILAFVGFLSAAITLTQKENLMNIVGWIIINWRGLFSEEDTIRISNFSGVVKKIGFLYFTLVESNSDFPGSETGRIIKVPNGMVSRNPIFNFSQEKLMEVTLSFVFKPKGELKALIPLFETLTKEIQDYFKSRGENINHYKPRYLVRLRQEKPAGFEMLFLFYCYYIDKSQLQSKLSNLVVDFCACNPTVALTFD